MRITVVIQQDMQVESISTDFLAALEFSYSVGTMKTQILNVSVLY